MTGEIARLTARLKRLAELLAQLEQFEHATTRLRDETTDDDSLFFMNLEPKEILKSLIVCGVIAAAALSSPWLIEGASNNCAAVERVGMRKVQAERASQSNSEQLGASIAMGFFALSDGRIAAGMAAKHLPDVPVPLACLVGYWRGRAEG